MNDTELDARLREWGAWAVETAPDGAGRRAPRRRAAWIAVAASVVVVLAIVAAMLVARPARHDVSPAATTPAPAPTLRTAVPAPGMRAVSFHGLTVDVPRSWLLNDRSCERSHNAVDLPTTGQTAACGVATPPPGVTVVELSSAQVAQDAHPVHVDGVRALRTDYDPRTHTVQVEVPALDASIEITTTDSARRRALIASLRLVDVDANGCATRLSAAPPVAGGTTRTGADELLVPINASRLHVCRYRDGQSEASAVVTEPRDIAAISTVFNNLSPGTDPSRTTQNRARIGPPTRSSPTTRQAHRCRSSSGCSAARTRGCRTVIAGSTTSRRSSTRSRHWSASRLVDGTHSLGITGAPTPRCYP